jgi:hypothetical protein
MSEIIPIDNSLASQELEVVLDGIPYNINFTYNSRFDFWTMSFKNLEDQSLVAGIKVVLGYPLLGQYVDSGLPKGEIFAIDTTDKETSVNRENFGETVQLAYITEDELASI